MCLAHPLCQLLAEADERVPPPLHHSRCRQSPRVRLHPQGPELLTGFPPLKRHNRTGDGKREDKEQEKNQPSYANSTRKRDNQRLDAKNHQHQMALLCY